MMAEPPAGDRRAELAPTHRAARRPRRAVAAAGLHDWKTFHAALRGAAIAATQGRNALAVLMIDLDRIAEIDARRDRGHAERIEDTIGRVLGAARVVPGEAAYCGGDRFGLILPATDLDGAVAIADRLRADLAAVAVPEAATLTAGD
jgi:PleD family two-component response regulator